jgi:dihydropteroate synthase
MMPRGAHLPSDRPQPAAGADRWRLRSHTLVLGDLPLLMGIVNVTPDSFSDGGRYQEPAAAVDRALELAAAGADLLDIGGESTRPGAELVDAAEELRRVLPVITALAERIATPLSIDTYKASVAREAVAAGAQIINDVTALTGDAAMLEVALQSGCGLCAMHTPGTPQSMHGPAVYGDVVNDVLAYLRGRRDALTTAGVDPARLALDPGIGFGKTTEQNLRILNQARRFHELRCPLLFGVSRKRFIGQVLGHTEAGRVAGTVGVALALARRGVQVLRVHDVGPVREALRLFQAAGGLQGVECEARGVE